MAREGPDTRVLDRGFTIARSVEHAETDLDALRLILQVAGGFVHATRSAIFTLDEKGELLLRASHPERPLADFEREPLVAVAKEALARHRERYPLKPAPQGQKPPPTTDEALPERLVAKVLNDHARVLAIAVIACDNRREFTRVERGYFSVLCMNAQGGLAKRRLVPGVEAERVTVTADIPRPAEIEKIVQKVQTRRLKRPREELRKPMAGILGDSEVMGDVREQIHRYADEKYPVVIYGETGTGKEQVARALHGLSKRNGKPFRAVNAGGLSPTLIESELFGHEKGSFTNATDAVKGLFREADGGTLFIDEVGEMPEDMQVKLLRVLESGEVKPVGAAKPVTVNVRIVCATHRDLNRLVQEGKFRLDLYHRLVVLEIRLPPLRERKGDAVLLAREVLEEEKRSRKADELRFSERALAAIEHARWEGNVRQLRNAVARGVVQCKDDVIEPADMGLEGADDLPALSAAENARRRELLTALRRHDGNKTHAAREVGVHRVTLLREMRKLEIPE